MSQNKNVSGFTGLHVCYCILCEELTMVAYDNGTPVQSACGHPVTQLTESAPPEITEQEWEHILEQGGRQ